MLFQCRQTCFARALVSVARRYLAKELLQENHSNLTKADVFSLGARCVLVARRLGDVPVPLITPHCRLGGGGCFCVSILELAMGTRLPVTGDEWERLRSDEIPYQAHLSKELNEIIALMMTVRGCSGSRFGDTEERMKWTHVRARQPALSAHSDPS